MAMATRASSGMPRTVLRASWSKSGPLISNQELKRAKREQRCAADRDHRSQCDDHGTDRQPLDEQRIEQPDRRPDHHARGQRRPWRQLLGKPDAAGGRRCEHDRADRKIDAADEHDGGEGQAEHQDRGGLAQDVGGVGRCPEDWSRGGEDDAQENRGDQHGVTCHQGRKRVASSSREGAIGRGGHAAAAPCTRRFRSSSSKLVARSLRRDAAVPDNQDAVGDAPTPPPGRRRRRRSPCLRAPSASRRR